MYIASVMGLVMKMVPSHCCLKGKTLQSFSHSVCANTDLACAKGTICLSFILINTFGPHNDSHHMVIRCFNAEDFEVIDQMTSGILLRHSKQLFSLRAIYLPDWVKDVRMTHNEVPDLCHMTHASRLLQQHSVHKFGPKPALVVYGVPALAKNWGENV